MTRDEQAAEWIDLATNLDRLAQSASEFAADMRQRAEHARARALEVRMGVSW